MAYPINGGTVRRNVVAACATRTTRWPMARQRMSKDVVKFDGPLTPFWSQGQLQAHLWGKECASICQKDASQNLRGIRTTCGERMVRRLAYRGSRRLRELGTLRYPSNVSKHHEIAQEGYPSFPCADGHSTSSIFLNANAAKCLRGEP